LKDFRNPAWKALVNKTLTSVGDLGIKFARLQFIDINGITKSLSVSTKRLESIFNEGQSFDGSSVTGFGSIEESDLTLFPDPSTYAVIPWRSKEKASCRLICDVYQPDGNRFEVDPRYVLEKTIEKCQKQGMTFYAAPELEFFFLRENEGGVPAPIDLGGYFDLHPGDLTEDLRRDIADYAEAFGIEIEIAHHEVALGQNEIDFKYGEALETADRAVTMKMITKSVASHHNYLATYMPKPFFGINGSGMHVHQSVWSSDGKRNLFYSDSEKSGYLSETALSFIAGQLEHGREICAVLASWPNSYKRLVPGYEAPVYIAWGFRNRSPLIRVPNFGGRPNAARMEIRCADPAGNPYLQFAALLAAGLDGVKNKLTAPPPADQNVYKLSYAERKKMKIISLPESLGEALHVMEKSSLVKETLGETLYENFIIEKHKEWDQYKMQVTQWEIERYIRRL